MIRTNPDFNGRPGDGKVFYTVLAAVGCILVIILLISAPKFSLRSDVNDTAAAEPAKTNGSETAAPPETDPPDTTPPDTAPPETDPPETAPPETDPPETAPPETQPPETTPPITTPPDTAPPETQPPETAYQLPPVDPAVHPCLLAETEDAGTEYLDDIVFIGDSTTYSFLYYGKLNGGTDSKQVWTPASRTLTLSYALTTTILYPDTGEEITIEQAVMRKKPRIIVITLGVNGVSFMNEEYFVSVYTKLVNMIAAASPDTKIILQSIFPVARTWEKMESINNEKINRANEWIRCIADDCGVRYLDTISVLAVDAGGYLPVSYQNGDGLHLNSNACDIVLRYIRTHALPDYVP